MGLFSSLLRKKPGHRVNLAPSGEDFVVNVGETVLESALKAKLAYPHDCTVGTCGTCRSKLLEGRVEAITPFGYTLSKAELEAGYILACQAIPKSDLKIAVDICDTALPAA